MPSWSAYFNFSVPLPETYRPEVSNLISELSRETVTTSPLDSVIVVEFVPFARLAAQVLAFVLVRRTGTEWLLPSVS